MKKTTAILAILFPVVFAILILLGFSAFGKKFLYLFGMPLGIGIPYLYAAFNFVRAPEKWIIERNYPWTEDTSDDCNFEDLKCMQEIEAGKRYQTGKTLIEIWRPGIHFLWFPIKPFMFVKKRLSCANKPILITLGINDGNPGGESLVDFKDVSVPVKVQLVIRVQNPLKATYAIDDFYSSYEEAAISRTEASFRRALSKMDLGAAMTDTDEQNRLVQNVFSEVNSAIGKWGVEVTNPGNEITILDFELTGEVLNDWQKPLKAKRAKEAEILQAEADKKRDVLVAEGQRQVAILQAEGKAKAIRLIFEAEGLGLAEKVNLMSKNMSISVHEVIDFLLKQGMITAAEKATLIATSESGRLNYPLEFGTAFSAASNAQSKHTKDGGSEPTS